MIKVHDDDQSCPHCGKKGLMWDYAAGQARCPHCHLSGFPVNESNFPPPAREQKYVTPKPSTNTEIERAALNANLKQEVTESYTRERPNGEPEVIAVKRIIPVVPQDKIPDLTINFARALFHKWRLRDLLDQEKRWGRDDLRKRGFRKIGRGIDPETQKGVHVIARPGEEDVAGTGRYALGHAIAIVRRAEQRLRNREKTAQEEGDNFESRDDI